MRALQPARLALRKARPEKRLAATWVIRDNGQEYPTGCSEGDLEGAEAAYTKHNLKKRAKPNFKDGDADKVLISTCLTFYHETHPAGPRQHTFNAEINRLNEFCGGEVVSFADRSQVFSDSYIKWRCAQRNARATKSVGNLIKVTTATRELVVLSAALNFSYHEKKLDHPVIIHHPDKPDSEVVALPRGDIARLLLGAMGWDLRGKKPVRNKFCINRHVAHFILIYYYTGTRHATILLAQWEANTFGGHMDIASGIYYRAPKGAIQTDKRRDPCAIPGELMRHLPRWQKLTARYVIEYRGKALKKIRKGWETAARLAGFPPGYVTPHAMKHSGATFLLANGATPYEVGKAFSTSEAVIKNTYDKNGIEAQRKTMARFSRSKSVPAISNAGANAGAKSAKTKKQSVSD